MGVSDTDDLDFGRGSSGTHRPGYDHAMDTSAAGDAHVCTCGERFETQADLLDHITNGGDD